MPDPVERYREFAAECLRIARQIENENEKARLIEMADAWQRLVDAAKRSPE